MFLISEKEVFVPKMFDAALPDNGTRSAGNTLAHENRRAAFPTERNAARKEMSPPRTGSAAGKGGGYLTRILRTSVCWPSTFTKYTPGWEMARRRLPAG